jgi:hypothetical protein
MTTSGQTMRATEEKNGKVSLETLATLTGFPVELIREEVFKGEVASQVSLDELRSAMLAFIDSTMLNAEEK